LVSLPRALPSTKPSSVDPTATIAAISAGIGLIMAKDATEKLEIKKSE